MRRKLQRNARTKRRLSVQSLESRRLLAADSIGVTPEDTGEFLLGTVAVTPVFFESDGTLDPNTEDWTENEISEILDKVHESVQWWSDTLDQLDTVHTIDFVVDDLYAVDPVETPYEPINRSSSQFNFYVGDFLTSQGYGDADSIEDGVKQFNHAQRLKHQTDWAFTIFVIDSSNDPDGFFPRGSSFTGAFAFAGGLFYVIPSTRPVSTYAHETGHIFWARDEYSGGGSYNSSRGYYNTQNLNAIQDNPDPNFVPEPSIMLGGSSLQQAFETNQSPASTLAQIGWQDSDGDGIFDVADVPLNLDAVGYFDASESVYRFSGTASAVALTNQNSSGTQSDITLNRVSQIQYRLDDGPWLVAASPDQPSVEFDLTLDINESDFSTIQWRAIDQKIGVVSPTITGSVTTPTTSNISLSGVAFLDQNANGQRDIDEPSLELANVTVSNADGSPLFSGSAAANEFPDGDLTQDPINSSLSALGTVFDTKVASFESADAGDVKVFQSFNLQQQRYTDRWTDSGARAVTFTATLDQPVGQVHVDTIGLDDASFARLEAYDSSGDLIGRITSETIANKENVSVTVNDPLGRISEIRVSGHAGTGIAISGLRFGNTDSVTTDAGGVWRLADLPQGSYRVDISPDLVIHQFSETSMEVDTQSGTSELIVSAAIRVDSPRHNDTVPADTNGDGVVEALDALLVINDISRNDSRVLSPNEISGDDIDVSNDGIITALDALLVINQIAQQGSTSLQSGSNFVSQTLPQSGEQVLVDFADDSGYAGDLAYPGDQVLAESIDTDRADERNGEAAFGFSEISTSMAVDFPNVWGNSARIPGTCV